MSIKIVRSSATEFFEVSVWTLNEIWLKLLFFCIFFNFLFISAFSVTQTVNNGIIKPEIEQKMLKNVKFWQISLNLRCRTWKNLDAEWQIKTSISFGAILTTLPYTNVDAQVSLSKLMSIKKHLNKIKKFKKNKIEINVGKYRTK